MNKLKRRHIAWGIKHSWTWCKWPTLVGYFCITVIMICWLTPKIPKGLSLFGHNPSELGFTFYFPPSKKLASEQRPATVIVWPTAPVVLRQCVEIYRTFLPPQCPWAPGCQTGHWWGATGSLEGESSGKSERCDSFMLPPWPLSSQSKLSGKRLGQQGRRVEDGWKAG